MVSVFCGKTAPRAEIDTSSTFVVPTRDPTGPPNRLPETIDELRCYWARQTSRCALLRGEVTKTGEIQPIDIPRYYTPKSLIWNLKMMVSNRNLLFQGLIFRFHVKLQGCNLLLLAVGLGKCLKVVFLLGDSMGLQ